MDWEAVKSLCPTFVFWDINSCPVPPGFDASLVGPCIKRFLKNEGCSGPLTIVAIGELTDIPNDILRKVYSSGINLHNVPYGPSGAYKVIFDPSPIRTGPLRNILLISSARIFAWKPDSLQTECNFLEPYPCDSLQIFCLAGVCVCVFVLSLSVVDITSKSAVQLTNYIFFPQTQQNSRSISAVTASAFAQYATTVLFGKALKVSPDISLVQTINRR